ncbi:hypothetical protein ACFPYN_11900 [Paenisporosarcina macmurdoensis]|uniref:XRE family transcriptional regulator n=1 Tax=Paenisporosarcina macmurdoensis TaxID=212659 RepID=A0ABW1L843_9BACL
MNNRILFRLLRGFMGISQKHLGAFLGGKDQSTIAYYESGKLRIPAKVASDMEELAKSEGITDFDILMLQKLITASASAKQVTKQAGASNE